MKKANIKKDNTGVAVPLRILRAVIPSKVRAVVGIWIVNKLSCWWPMVQLYTKILYGRALKGMKPVTGGNVSYNYRGREIIAPRNAIPVFIEIFAEDIYDRWFKPTGTVVDIGAFVGMFTVKAAFEARNVIAIEPCPETFAMLETNCLNLPNIKLVKKALWSKPGIAKLYKGTTNLGTSPIWGGNSLMMERSSYYEKDDYIEVELTTLDILMDKPVDFIKMDAEGAELEILKGAERTLTNPGMKLAIAAYHKLANGECELPYVVSFLEARRFKVYTDGEFVYAELKQPD